MLLFAVKFFVACWITLMSSVGVWFPIFFVRRPGGERATTLLTAGARGRLLRTTATSATTRLWLSLANMVSAGMLLAMALLHFFPESLGVKSGTSPDSVALCGWMLVGVLIPAVLERSLQGGGAHSHDMVTDSEEEHVHARGSGSSVSASKLLIVLMCCHGMTEGLLLGFEKDAAALLSAAAPLSVHKFCDGLVIGVSIAKQIYSETEEEFINDRADSEACARVSYSRNRFWRQLFEGPVGVWLLVTPITMICLIIFAVLLGGAAPPGARSDLNALPPAAPAERSTASRISPVSILAAVQAIGSGSFVYIGLTILSREELKGMASNAALLAGVGLTGALFHITSGYH
ncbi:hypothetical_protein [Leishmania braziliensis MHOM/BR/75/M2904]|nr:hypothetical_protein [Leishmania braziliensis MHOM/BR/75/M2904]